MSNNKSGAEIRKENRDQREEKRFLLARKLIDKYIDFIKILESEDHQKYFNLMWAKFDKNLRIPFINTFKELTTFEIEL